MNERWIVRLLVTRDPDVDPPPTQWDWDIEGADVTVLAGDLAPQVVGLAPEPHDWTAA